MILVVAPLPISVYVLVRSRPVAPGPQGNVARPLSVVSLIIFSPLALWLLMFLLLG